MEMKGEQRIQASRQVVWAALNDPDVLRVCIPGCEELVKQSDTEMTAVAVIKVGPVRAKFQGAVTLSELDPPNGYRISGEGQGGISGFAKGTAVVRLRNDGDATILAFEVVADIGGKLSQLGARLIDATAKQLSAAFFRRFAEEIDQRSRPQGIAAGSDRSEPSAAAPKVRSSSPSGYSARPAGSPVASSHLPMLAVAGAALVLAAILLVNSSSHALAPTRSIVPEFLHTVVLLIVLAVGYLLGRHSSGGDAVRLDPQSIEALAAALKEQHKG